MGKATIISGGEDGRYTIEVDLGEDAKAQRIARLNAAIAEKTTQIAAAEAALAAVEATVTPARLALTVATDAYIAAVNASGGDPAAAKTELAALEAARKALAPLQAVAQSMRVGLAALKADKVVLQKQLTATQSITATLTQQAWCADLTEDATGEVATIEIPGEQNLILIQAAAPAPTSGDGRLVARELQSPEQVYWNAAALPGWQKWHPTYRTGTISNISNEFDTADVALDAATSSAQSLNVNLLDTLHAIPIQYMTCNADAFEDGDHVVVRFDGVDGWSAPTVIGFVTDPKECVPWPQYVRVPVHMIAEDITPGVGTRNRLYSYGPDPWGCGYTEAKVFNLNLPICASATINFKIMEPVGRMPDLIDGMTINGVTQGTIWTREATAHEQNLYEEVFCPGDDGANYVRSQGNSSGILSVDEVVYTQTEMNLPTVVTGLCFADAYYDFHYFTSAVHEVVAPQPLQSFVASHGGMPTVTITYGERTKEYEFLEADIDSEATGGPFINTAKMVLIYQRVDD